ncbi:MAG TPA: 2-oxoacid:ferredoxin oxidoreductase subunit beta [Polyangiaceae bacterium]|jgi:2-oxoglutarate ferredoxin oxidoreductase subunit beta|nr:2-oxoacid:ferredoxin oxidoreductase subunit beta [Polyangiaceae bacterium]
MTDVIPSEKLTRKDFESDQDVRWCPGCGDYAILATVQRTLPELGVQPHQMVWVSGIGCSSRFPYYMNTYGFHTIHGRAPAIATGLKVANPELQVWVVTGDGDGLSIGGNHLMHCLRRNVDVKILMFNNRIYGLTKGQYSPTSEVGKITKSTPLGSADYPVDPVAFALGCNAGFVARSIDVEAKHLAQVIKRAAAHKGTTFTEIYQNCNVFNDGAFEMFRAREVKADKQLLVEHGKPLLFGEHRQKGLRLNPARLSLEVVTVGENGITENDILVHDETNPNLALLLARMPFGPFPVALGVLYAHEQESYDSRLSQQLRASQERSGRGDLKKLLNSGETWTV